MEPIAFPCPSCRQRVAVGPELSGKSVRCPHCLSVVTAPTVSAPVPAQLPTPVTPTPPAFRSGPVAVEHRREAADSILADPDEEHDDPDCALGGHTPPAARKTTPADIRPPLPRLPEPTPMPPAFTPPAAQPHNPWAGFVAPSPASVPIPPPAPRTEAPPAPAPVAPAPESVRRAGVPLWVTLAVTAWAVLATGLAAWGWLRTPAAAPAPTVPSKSRGR